MRLRLLPVSVLVPLVWWAVLPVPGHGQDVGQLQRQLDDARGTLERKKGAEQLLTTDVTTYTGRIRALDRRIDGLRSRERRAQETLARERGELLRIQARLRDERARLARLRARLVEVRRALSDRLVEIFKAERPDALTVILNSDGFAALLERADFLSRIAEQDRRIVATVRDAKRAAVATEARLAALEDRQQRLTAQQLVRRNEIAAVKRELIGTRVGAQRARAAKTRALRSVRTDRRELEAEVRAISGRQAAIKAKLASASSSRSAAPAPVRRGTGALIWPVNGAISSPFGMRWGRLHAGIDIPAADGTPIRAADGGRVVIAGWESGYGNYTCIQHTAALSTCYAHQSRLGTSVGAVVDQGEIMGYVGNTGHSFGAHLHFEVRVSGQPVDPTSYL